MEITLREITVADLTDGYRDAEDSGVFGYGGKLDIRPPFQREFVYSPKQRDAVIDTLAKGFPLNVMYWSDRGDGSFEIIDGQQRSVSICRYVSGGFSHDDRFFDNLPADRQAQILDYRLMVYVCRGEPSEKLEWFRTINIAGEVLTAQELRNATFAGPWLSDAKRWFSKPSCAAHKVGQDYLKGSPIRQDYLETALGWISGGDIEDYMGHHQHDPDASELWEHYRAVIDWIGATFPTRRPTMRAVNRGWGPLYDAHRYTALDPAALEAEVSALHADDDVTNHPGIYHYVLTRDEQHLSIRAFSKRQKQRAYERQRGLCNRCGEQFGIEEMHGDHIDPWADGGRTDDENCQMLCAPCNRRKGAK